MQEKPLKAFRVQGTVFVGLRVVTVEATSVLSSGHVLILSDRRAE